MMSTNNNDNDTNNNTKTTNKNDDDDTNDDLDDDEYEERLVIIHKALNPKEDVGRLCVSREMGSRELEKIKDVVAREVIDRPYGLHLE